MPKGNFVNDYASIWEGMNIGDSYTFHNVHRGAVITSFNNWVAVRGLNWKCSTAVVESKGENAPPRKVIVKRVDPGNGDHSERELLKELNLIPRCYWEVNMRTHRFRNVKDKATGVYRSERLLWSAQRQIKASKHGWEVMEVGAMRLVKSPIHPLKYGIIKTCFIHATERRFLIRRVRDPFMQGDDGVWHRVERVHFDMKELPLPDYALVRDDY
jgi:hypothetical protein